MPVVTVSGGKEGCPSGPTKSLALRSRSVMPLLGLGPTRPVIWE